MLTSLLEDADVVLVSTGVVSLKFAVKSPVMALSAIKVNVPAATGILGILMQNTPPKCFN